MIFDQSGSLFRYTSDCEVTIDDFTEEPPGERSGDPHFWVKITKPDGTVWTGALTLRPLRGHTEQKLKDELAEKLTWKAGGRHDVV